MQRASIDKLRNRHLLVVDAMLAALVPFLLYLLRYEGLHWPTGQLETLVAFTAVTVPVRLLIYYLTGMYKQLWRFAGISELELVFLAGVAGAIASFFVGRFIDPALGISPRRMGLAMLFNGGMLNLVFLAAPRVFVRLGRVPL